jgi:hypothetical protein
MAAAGAYAQIPVRPASIVNPTAAKPLLTFGVMTDLEKHLDERISAVGGAEPLVLLGPARALYLAGYGAVVTQEVSLAITPTINPFQPKITPQDVARVHQKKVERIPLLKQLMPQMWVSTAETLNMVPDTEQIVVAVRLLYKSWEDTKGLPGQIVLRGTRGAGLAGVQTEEQ